MDVAFRKLELRMPLAPEEKAAFASVFWHVRVYQRDQDLLSEGETPAFCGVLLEGLLCRHRTLDSGGRQILSFPMAGDVFDLNSYLLETADHTVSAISRCRVAMAPHEAVQALMGAHPRLGRLLLRDAMVEGSVFREWIVNCGRRTGYARTAHLFCELFTRAEDVGLVKQGSCRVELTQSDLADAVGRSIVHVNRVLQRLRSEELIAFRSSQLTVLDWEGLATAGEFGSAYLHMADAAYA